VKFDKLAPAVRVHLNAYCTLSSNNKMGGDGGSGGALSNILSGTVAGFAQVAAGKMQIHEKPLGHVLRCAALLRAESCAATASLRFMQRMPSSGQ
jgi:hypothetical protein